MDLKVMKLFSGNRLKRLVPRFLLSALLLIPASGVASVWPDTPSSVPLDSPDPTFKFAAGLYNSQEALSGSFNTNQDYELLARAHLAASRLDEVLELLEEGLIPSRDLAVQISLMGDSELEEAEVVAWRGAFRGEDGESLYWKARLAEKLGKNAEGRRLYEKLLRERPASVFVPVSQERLASLPFEDASLHLKPPAIEGGFRIQWGVFRDTARARQMKSVLVAYGYSAEILSFEREGIPLGRVVSEAFATRDEALREGESIRARYGMDFVVFAEESAP